MEAAATLPSTARSLLLRSSDRLGGEGKGREGKGGREVERGKQGREGRIEREESTRRHVGTHTLSSG